MCLQLENGYARILLWEQLLLLAIAVSMLLTNGQFLPSDHLAQQLLTNIAIMADSSDILNLLHDIALDAIVQPYFDGKRVRIF